MTVSGAAGQIGYALLPLLANGMSSRPLPEAGPFLSPYARCLATTQRAAGKGNSVRIGASPHSPTRTGPRYASMHAGRVFGDRKVNLRLLDIDMGRIPDVLAGVKMEVSVEPRTEASQPTPAVEITLGHAPPTLCCSTQPARRRRVPSLAKCYNLRCRHGKGVYRHGCSRANRW